jgi:predicted CoA-substrate-specific enzyme activase
MNGLFLGIDVGAAAAKAVLLDGDGQVLARAVVPTGLDFGRAGAAAARAVLTGAGAAAEDVRGTVATGYGRRNLALPALSQTEISCHARGAHHHFPRAITVVDIGGQDNKIIRVGEDGRLLGFRLNRKCAAGTGVFLEEIARRLDLPLSSLEGLARESAGAVRLGSFCTVFTFTEILTLMRQGVEVPDIVHAAFRAVVQRVMEMEALEECVVATGGVVAHNPVVIPLLAEAAGVDVLVPPDPQLTGALGAALLARNEVFPRC